MSGNLQPGNVRLSPRPVRRPVLGESLPQQRLDQAQRSMDRLSCAASLIEKRHDREATTMLGRDRDFVVAACAGVLVVVSGLGVTVTVATIVFFAKGLSVTRFWIRGT